jgi:hypothetical protein
MRKILPAATVLLLVTAPLAAESWSLGVGTGPFVFGTFAERTTKIVTESGEATTRSKLSAATRPGGTADIERSFSDRLGVRLEASWTRAPMKVKSSSGEGVAFDAGHASIATFALPLVFTINPRGTFRFQLAAGPAYGFYRMTRRTTAGGTLPLFEGTRGRWGGVAGGGVAWWLSDRFAIEGKAEDIVTTSPFRREDFGSSQFGGLEIPKTHNVHTTAGIRYRFR